MLPASILCRAWLLFVGIAPLCAPFGSTSSLFGSGLQLPPLKPPLCRPPPCFQIVLRKLCLALMPKLDDELRHSTAQDAAFYEHRLQVGARGVCLGA